MGIHIVMEKQTFERLVPVGWERSTHLVQKEMWPEGLTGCQQGSI